MKIKTLISQILLSSLTGLLAAPSFADTIHDSRDGRDYEVVRIGKQLWMAENLKYAAKNSYCYDNDSENCEKYGRLYTWKSALGNPPKAVTDEQKEAEKERKKKPQRGNCPYGFHVPTLKEFQKLLSSEEGRSAMAMKADSTWEKDRNGNNSSGFNVLASGYKDYVGVYYHMGTFTSFWSATEYNEDSSYLIYIEDIKDVVEIGSTMNSNTAMPVRCVK